MRMLAARVQGREEKATDSAASNKAVEAELAAIKAALQLGLDLAVAPARRSSLPQYFAFSVPLVFG